MKPHFRLGLLVAVVSLSACGGGSSDTSTGYPIDSAISAYFQAHHSYTLKGSDGSNFYTDTHAFVPGGMQMFQGISALTATDTGVLTNNGHSLGSDTVTSFFLIGPYKPLGAIDVSSGYVMVDANQQILPDLASVGDSGKFYTATVYSDASLTTVLQSDVVTWDLTSVTADTAMLCEEFASTTLSTKATHNTSSCYVMDQRGNVTGVEETIEVNGIPILLK